MKEHLMAVFCFGDEQQMVHHLMLQSPFEENLSFFFKKMGIAIFFFQYRRYFKNVCFSNIAINITFSLCLLLYTELKQFLNEHPDSLSLNIRFLNKHEYVDKNLIELFLISLYYLGIYLFIEAFDRWNLEKDYRNLYSSFRMERHSEKAHIELLRHRKWGNKLKISDTSIVFFNDKELPDIYTNDDLDYFILTREDNMLNV